jgi:hypothetical protein
MLHRHDVIRCHDASTRRQQLSTQRRHDLIQGHAGSMLLPPKRVRDELHRRVDRVLDHPRRHPHDAPPELVKRAVSPRVLPLSVAMAAPVDLDDEPHRRRREVDDKAGDDELPAEPHAELTPPQPLPEQPLGPRGREPLRVRKDREAMTRAKCDETTRRTVEHGDLQRPSRIGPGAAPQAQEA